MVRELTPFATNQKVIASAETRDPNKAKEVAPLVLFGPVPVLMGVPQGIDMRPRVDDAGQESTAKKVEAEDDNESDDDPKAPAASSATNSASPSGTGTSENGQQIQTETSTIIHPSSLPQSQEAPASAEKDLSEQLPPLPTS